MAVAGDSDWNISFQDLISPLKEPTSWFSQLEKFEIIFFFFNFFFYNPC